MFCKPCLIAATAFGSISLFAAMAPAPQAAPTAATAATATTWTVDDVHSMAMFRVQHNQAGMFWGRFDAVAGTVTTSGAGPDALAFDITIDVDSVSSGNDKLNAHLKSPDFFDAKTFPKMVFKSTKSSRGENGLWDVSGDLTIHGVTKPVTAKVEMVGSSKGKRGMAAGFEATFTVDRSQFGMSYGVEQGGIGKDVRVIVGLEVNAPSN